MISGKNLLTKPLSLPLLWIGLAGLAYPALSSAQVHQSVQVKATLSTDKQTDDQDDKTYTSVEVMPEFPGGQDALMQYLISKLNYPSKARKEGIQGRVMSRFVIKKDGSVDDIEIVRGLSPECDEEVVQVLKSMPKWIPGKQEGKAVNTYYVLPVSFSLPGEK